MSTLSMLTRWNAEYPVRHFFLVLGINPLPYFVCMESRMARIALVPIRSWLLELPRQEHPSAWRFSDINSSVTVVTCELHGVQAMPYNSYSPNWWSSLGLRVRLLLLAGVLDSFELILHLVDKWSVVAERSSLPDSSSGVSNRMWVRIPAVTLVSLSMTLNHNCFSPPRG